MTVRYKQQQHDGPRTWEQQMFLLAHAAQRVSEAHWHRCDSEGESKLGAAVAHLNRTITETDVFMSGYQLGRRES